MSNKQKYTLDNPAMGSYSTVDQDKERGISKHASKSEKTNIILKVAVAVLAVLLVIAVIVIILSALRIITYPTKDCRTTACQDLASRVKKYMDPKADPCEDFSQYACGGFLRNRYIPVGTEFDGSFNDLITTINNFFYEYLNFGITDKDPEYQIKLRHYFGACMSGASTEAEIPAILSFAENYLNTSTSKWTEPVSIDGISNFLGKAGTLDHNLNVIMTLVTPNPLKRGSKILLVHGKTDISWTQSAQSSTANSNTTASVPTEVELMQQAIEKTYTLLQTINLKMDNQSLTNSFVWALNLSKIKTNVTPSGFMANIKNQNTVKDLQNNIPGINWKVYLKALLGRDVQDSYQISTPYYEYLSSSIDMISTAQDRINAKNYITLSMLETLTGLGASTAQADAPPKFNTCFPKMGQMPFALEGLFLDKFFKQYPNLKTQLENMILFVRKAFVENVMNSDWLSQTMKDRVKAKADAMSSSTLYPVKLKDPNFINGVLKNINPTLTNFGRTSLELIILKHNVDYGQLFSDESKTYMFGMPVQVVQAFFNPRENDFTILAGIVNDPFFEPGAPEYMIYGSLGTIVGHEMTHGFDNNGRKYDKNGLYRDWWTKDAGKTFNERAQCFVEEYNKLTVIDKFNNKVHNIDGKLTLAENIADAGGLHASEMAYASWRKENGEEKMLPGFSKDMTQMKLFYIALGQVYCDKSSPAAIKFNLQETHTPGMPRINGFAMNSHQFAKTFNCPIGSKMNPVRKCALW